MLGACGKKGPPLAPIVHIPAAVEKLTAQRVGNDVYLTFTIPNENIDGSTPADVSRVDILAVTATTAPPRARMFELATAVATIKVQPLAEAAAAAAPAVASAPLPAQGATVTVRETLTPDALTPTAIAEPVPPRRGSSSVPVAPSPTVATNQPARRYYFAVAVSDRGRPGPPGTLIELPLLPLPDPPGALSFTYTEDSVTIAWEPAGGVLGFVLDRTLPPEESPVDEPAGAPAVQPPAIAPPSGPTMYNVYRERSPAPDAPGDEARAGTAAPPAPLNMAPIAGLSYTDEQQVQLDEERCYTVRAVRGTPPNLVIGPASPRQCMVTVDRFPPEPPTGLSAIAGDGVISLLWEPNGEADLGGYVVLRGRPGDDTLQRLTSAPVAETRFADRDVQPGVRYVYAVQAVDTHQPAANVSAESERVEETAR